MVKNVSEKIISLLQKGFATPQIARISRRIHEPSTTIHYNIQKLEKEGIIRNYKAVFDYNLLGRGFCAYALINLNPGLYSNPDKIAGDLSRLDEVESVDVIAGNWEIIIKIRVGDQESYYSFLNSIMKKDGVKKVTSLISLKEFKSEWVENKMNVKK